jgi:hypothetical protein
MVRTPLLMASLGLAVSVVLWSVPAMVGASGLARVLFPNGMPTLGQALATAERSAGPHPGLLDALTQLIGAQAEALEVTGLGLLQPPPVDLAPRANRAGARVLDAVQSYVRAAADVVGTTTRH